MPSFDGGHYFLTTLIPVRTDADGPGDSHVHQLRSRLARLPTALQSPASERRGLKSPFARNRRTHLLRLLVIDDVAFNGRERIDAIKVAALTGIDHRATNPADPTTPNPVDHLACPYLVFAADFDAQAGPAGEPQAFLRGLWADAETELREIVEHCHGFSEVKDADGFARAVAACEVDTTMPFNDYWQTPPDLTKLGMSILPVLIPAAIGALVFLAGLAGLVFGEIAGWVGLLLGAAILYLGLRFAVNAILAHGARPLPAAPDSDLPSVLKALYLRQNFVRFAIDHQGAAPADLHAAFGAFLAAHRPGDVAGPTQPPGVVRS